jgi:hypothetical protein
MKPKRINVMEFTINQEYGLCYREEILSALLQFGLSSDEADIFMKRATKNADLSSLREKFTGNDRQFDIIAECCKTAVQKGHGVASFLSVGCESNHPLYIATQILKVATNDRY